MLKYDQGRMWIAVGRDSNQSLALGPEFAYLNRVTGDIVFFYDKLEDAISAWGESAGVDSMLDRACVLANPQDWVLIPRDTHSWRHSDPDSSQEAFIQNFFAENGIEV